MSGKSKCSYYHNHNIHHFTHYNRCNYYKFVVWIVHILASLVWFIRSHFLWIWFSAYIIVEVPNSCNFIKTLAECEAAAQYLGLNDTSAKEVNGHDATDPPYCYFEGGQLKFNSNGTNTGDCGNSNITVNPTKYDKCLCKIGKIFRCSSILSEKMLIKF